MVKMKLLSFQVNKEHVNTNSCLTILMHEDNSEIRETYEYEWNLYGIMQTYGKLFR